MARKRKEEEYQIFNGGGVGYSQDALDALMRGQYDQLTGRDPKYRTSQEQTLQAKSLPVLKGIELPKQTTSADNNWRSNFSTDRARRSYEQRIGHTPTSNIKADSFEQYDKDMKKAEFIARTNGQSMPEMQEAMKNLPSYTMMPEKDRKEIYKQSKAEKPSSKYQNNVIAKSVSQPKKSTRDKSFDSDFDEFYDYRAGDYLNVVDYDAEKDADVEHWRNLKKDIMKKHNWSEKEFDKRWNEYYDERNQETADTEVKMNLQLAKDLPVLGTIGQFAYTPQTWVEGAMTGIQGASAKLGQLTGKNPLKDYTPTSSSAPQFTGTRVKEGIKQEVRDNHIKSDLGKFLYESGTGLGDMALSLALPGGALGTALQKASNKQMQALERGINSENAARTAALQGINGYILGKVGLDKVFGAAGKTPIRGAIKGGLIEGAENVVEDWIDYAIDAWVNGDKSELNTLHDYYVSQGGDENAWTKVIGDKAEEAATSFGSGAIAGGLFNAAKNLPELKSYISSKGNNSLGIIPQEMIDLIASDSRYKSEFTAKTGINLGDSVEENKAIIADYYNRNENPQSRIGWRSPEEAEARKQDILKQAYRLRDGEMGHNEMIELGMPEPYLAELGDINNRMVMTQGNAKKIALSPDEIEGGHGMGYEAIADIPEKFHNPAAVMRSQKYPENSAMILTGDLDEHQNPVLYPVHMDKLKGDEIVTEVPSGQGRHNAERLYKNSDVLFENKERVDNTFRKDGVRFPERRDESDSSFNKRIDQTTENVNGDIPPADSNRGESAVITNSAKNANIVTQEQIDNDPVIRSIAEYEKHSNESTLNAAKENVVNNGAELLEDFNSGKKAINSDQTVDESFLLLRSLTKQIEELGENAPKELIQKKNLLLSRLRKAGTKYGQTIQAFAKWNKTPEGAVINGERILEERTEKYKSRNKKSVKQNNKLAKELNNIGRGNYDTTISNGGGYKNPNGKSNAEKTSARLNKALRQQGYDGTMEAEPKSPKTHEQHRLEVENSIRKELGSVSDILNDRDYEILTNYVENNVPVDIIADEIEHRLNYGEWYTIDESTPIKKQKSSKIAAVLKNMGDDSLKEKNRPKDTGYPKKSRATIIDEIRNTLEDEPAAVELDKPNDLEFLATLVEEGVPNWKIEDEIRHRLETGEWYTLDESTPLKKAKSSKLSKILKDMGDGSLKAKNQKPETGYPKKSHATISEEVANTLEGEYAALGLDTPTDIEFMTIMLEEGIPAWQIEDEINHRLMTGEWYSLDESVESSKPISQKLQNALNMMVDSGEKPPKVELSIDEIRERVRNTLEKDAASYGISRLYTDQGDVTDTDVDYLSFLIKNGATTQEIADALNTKAATGTFAISPDTEQKAVDLFKYAEKVGTNSKKGVEAMNAAYALIADEVVGEATPFEKFETWRYLAMLGNTKTMVRNGVGNVLFGTTTGFSNNLAALIESGADKAFKKSGGIQRQKAILNPAKDAGLIKTAWADGEQNRWSDISGTKYEKSQRDAIKSQKSVFNNKLLQLYEKATDLGISDTGFVHTKYSTSLAGYLKANGLGEEAFRAEPRYNKLLQDSQTRVLTDSERAEMQSLKQTIETLEKARDYAVAQAKYATFHEDNAFAQWLTKNIQDARNSDNAALRVIGTIGEGIVPFKGTPANIVKSGFEYSPLGAIKSIAETGKLIYENTGKRKGNLEDVYQKTNKFNGKTKEVKKSLASDVIESWAKTMTGSALAMFGYYLADKGILRAGGKGDKYQNDLEGKQEYSLEINGKTYTVDWAAPAVMPMLLGAEAQKVAEDNLVSNESVFKDIDKTIGTFNALLDPILETSFMQGIQNALESAANQVRYSKTDNGDGSVPGGIAGAMASNALASYVTQGIPTFLGQIARTVDPIRRATDTAADSNFIGEFEKTARKTANKIPFLSKYVNEPYYDAYGRTQNNSPFENPLANFAYQALSPAYVADVNETSADKSARGAYEGLVTDENGNQKPLRDSKAFATWKNKVTINGEQLDPQQMAEYRKVTGETNYAIRTALASEDWFNEMSPTKQTEILNKVNNLVDKVGKEKYTPGTGKDYEVYQEGGIPSLLNYYKNSEAKKEVQEKTGLNATSNAAKTIMADLESGNKVEAEQKIDEATQLANLGFTKPGPTDTYYKAKGIVPILTTEEFARTYKAIDADGNQGIKQDEILAYLNKGNYTEAEGVQIWNMYAPKGKKVPYIKEDGTWGKH